MFSSLIINFMFLFFLKFLKAEAADYMSIYAAPVWGKFRGTITSVWKLDQSLNPFPHSILSECEAVDWGPSIKMSTIGLCPSIAIFHIRYSADWRKKTYESRVGWYPENRHWCRIFRNTDAAMPIPSSVFEIPKNTKTPTIKYRYLFGIPHISAHILLVYVFYEFDSSVKHEFESRCKKMSITNLSVGNSDAD